MSERTEYALFAHRSEPRLLPDRGAAVRQCSPVVTIRSETPRRTRASATAAIVAAIVAMSACSTDETPSAERFCGEVAANKDALTSPQLLYADDIEPLLDLYRSVGALAPLGVEDDWNQLWWIRIDGRATLVPGDAAAEAALRAKYPQYRGVPLYAAEPLLIRIEPTQVTTWGRAE